MQRRVRKKTSRRNKVAGRHRQGHLNRCMRQRSVTNSSYFFFSDFLHEWHQFHHRKSQQTDSRTYSNTDEERWTRIDCEFCARCFLQFCDDCRPSFGFFSLLSALVFASKLFHRFFLSTTCEFRWWPFDSSMPLSCRKWWMVEVVHERNLESHLKTNLIRSCASETFLSCIVLIVFLPF